MLHIVNISHARTKLASLVKSVAQTKNPVVIVRDSIPSVIIYPYSTSVDQNDYKAKLLSISGDWFSQKEYQEIRKEVDTRLSRKVV